MNVQVCSAVVEEEELNGGSHDVAVFPRERILVPLETSKAGACEGTVICISLSALFLAESQVSQQCT